MLRGGTGMSIGTTLRGIPVFRWMGSAGVLFERSLSPDAYGRQYPADSR